MISDQKELEVKFEESIKKLRRRMLTMWVVYGGDLELPGGFPITKDDLPLHERLPEKASISFSVYKPGLFRRSVVMLHMGKHSTSIVSTWSWDRADSLAEKLNSMVRSQ